MEEKILRGRIRNAAKTNEQWLAIDPILKRGEKVWVISTTEPITFSYKIGDGISKYSELGYVLSQGQDIINYARHSVNIGYKTQTGCLGYRIKDMQPAISVTPGATSQIIAEGGTYTIDLEEGQTIDTNLLGCEYTINLKATIERVGIITAINGNVITVKPFFYPNYWPDHKEDKIINGELVRGQDYWYPNSYIFCDSYPNSGYIQIGDYTFAEGYQNKSLQFAGHSEGVDTIALGKYGHSEGQGTVAGYAAHSQNKYTKALGYHSNAQNYGAVATGENSDAGGYTTTAGGKNSFSRGDTTSARHENSSTFGERTRTSRKNQMVAGQFNADSSDSLLIIGNGANDNNRKNALEVKQDGRISFPTKPKNLYDGVNKDFITTFLDYKTKIFLNTSNGEWIRIGSLHSKKYAFPSNAIFKINFNYNLGAIWSTILFSVSSCINTTPQITILNYNNSSSAITNDPEEYLGINSIRITREEIKNGKDENGKEIPPDVYSYVEIYSGSRKDKNGNIDIWTGLNSDYTTWSGRDAQWSLIDPIIVTTASASTLTTVRCDTENIHAKFNALAEQDAATKVYTKQLSEQIVNNKNSITSVQNNINRNEKRIANLEQHISPDYFVTDDSTAYKKDIPINACTYAQLNSFGGMTYKSDNLIDYEALLSSNGFTKQDNGYWQGTGKTITLFDNTESKITGKLSISYIGKPIETVGNYSIYILVYYTDGSNEYIGHLYSNNTSYVNISVSTNPDKVVQTIIKSSGNSKDIYEIKDIMLNWGEPKVYEPYFEGLRDSAVTELKARGSNKLGGTALSSAILSNVVGSNSYEKGKRIGFPCTNAKGFVYSDFKPNTEYTFIFYGYNSKNTEKYSNLALRYTDGKSILTVSGNSSFLFETAGTPSYAIAYSNPSKSVATIRGSYETGTTYLYPDKCGIFEGHVTLEEFQAYQEKTMLEIPAEIQALPNYGKEFTTIDLINKTYVLSVTDLTPQLTIEVIAGEDLIESVDEIQKIIYKYPLTSSGEVISEIISADIDYSSSPYIVTRAESYYNNEDKCFYCILYTTDWSSDEYQWLAIEPVKQIVADISTLLPEDFEIIEVEGGGSIEFVNEYGNPVPSSISYMLKESES